MPPAATTHIPADTIPLPADIASWALAAGATTTGAIDAIAHSLAAHLHGDWSPLRWNTLLNEIKGDYYRYSRIYIGAHFDHHYDLWSGLTFDDLNRTHATQLLGHLVERATKELSSPASGTATNTPTTAEDPMDNRPAIDYYFTPDEVAAHATAAGASEQDVIQAVAWMTAADLLVGHHALIPFHRVVDDIATELRTWRARCDQDNRWDWATLAHQAVLAADDRLFQGILTTEARLYGEAYARVQVGAIITERAALRIWPDTKPHDRRNPDIVSRLEALRAERDAVLAEALSWARKHTPHTPVTWDVNVLDQLTNAETATLIDHLTTKFPTRPDQPADN